MRSLTTLPCCLLMTASILMPGVAFAFHLPLWELGAGIGYIHAPLYRGSTSTKDYFIPFPYLAYRGKTFRSDEEGLYSKIFDTDRINLDISIAGNVPVPSDVEGARKGMNKLDPVGELGPQMGIVLWKPKDPSYEYGLFLPVRAVLSVGSPLVKYRGWVFSPFLQMGKRFGVDTDWWRYRLSIGPIFADTRYHNYFYEVNPEDVTGTRTEYHPGGGYSGSRLTMTLSHYTKHYFFGAFVRVDDLASAAFVNSPLVETKHYLVTGFAFAWTIRASKTMAPHVH